MSSCSSESSPGSQAVDRSLILAAVDRRLDSDPPKQKPMSPPRITTAYEFEAFGDNHALRVEFRRLINPGIVRNNPARLALNALRVLCTIADNILKHPGQDRYLMVDTTKDTVKTLIVEPKGTVEVLVKLGFREKPVDNKRCYRFHEKYLETLRVGTHCLKEALNEETNKQEATEQENRKQKANQKAAKTKVNNAFYEDRRRKKEADDRERDARATAALNRQTTVTSSEKIADDSEDAVTTTPSRVNE